MVVARKRLGYKTCVDERISDFLAINLQRYQSLKRDIKQQTAHRQSCRSTRPHHRLRGAIQGDFKTRSPAGVDAVSRADRYPCPPGVCQGVLPFHFASYPGAVTSCRSGRILTMAANPSSPGGGGGGGGPRVPSWQERLDGAYHFKADSYELFVPSKRETASRG